METNPQLDMTALSARIDRLHAHLSEVQGEISNMQHHLGSQLSDIVDMLQGIPVLTTISNVRFNQGNVIHSQEQNGVVMGHGSVVYGKSEDLGEDRNNPPLVPEGTEVECVRCGYKWIPYARRPHQCASCRAPWWFPPKWRWHQGQAESR